MTDQELEQQLRAWYVADVGASETAPPDLRDSLAAIPASTPTTLRRGSRRRGLTLLAVAAVLVVGGAFAAGSGLVHPTPVVTPPPNVAIVPPSVPPASVEPLPTSVLRPGDSIAFTKIVLLKPDCPRYTTGCVASRVWIVGSDGRDAHALLPEGTTNQDVVAWSPDGTHLLYADDGKLYVTDANGSRPIPVDTGCVKPCFSDSQVAFSSDGRSIVFVRASSDATTVIATMDLASGRVTELSSTESDASAMPAWSPDGKQIVFFRVGEKDGGGPVPPRLSAVWVVDADGQNLRQASPLGLAAQDPGWSPDGTRILFESPDGSPVGGKQDIYTVRPDGSDVRRLTTDGVSTDATWTADGRILFVRSPAAGGASPGWWTMDADGTGAAVLVTNAQIGVKTSLAGTRPLWQPAGGSAIVPPPWTAGTAIAVGPPAPTPSPTATPSLAPGFAWTGTGTAVDGAQLGGTATLLADGRVLFAGTCSTAAVVYDPSAGTFTPTGSMTVVRAGATATRLQDGRVLFTGGSECDNNDTGGMWASAELYDPAAGTFSATGSMQTPRENHTATLLADGRVLITGGITGPRLNAMTGVTLAAFRLADTSANVLKTAEVYDPATGTFSPTGSMSSIRDEHTATLLADGRVLVVGGGGEGYTSVSSADLYDPSTGTFSKTGSMKSGRYLHTATLLEDGRVLVTGGRSPQDSVYTAAEMYDPATGKFSSAGSMNDGRQQHTATLLKDGRVFIAGGYWSDGQNWLVESSTEVYDPTTGIFSPTGSMGAPRDGHTATLLDDGRVLIAGGEDIGNAGGVTVASAVLYQP